MEDNKDEILDENLENEEVEKPEEEFNHGNIDNVLLSGKLKQSFLNYAMSVIVDRALPDARDGLKPVQRRILYGMDELKVYYNVAHKKSARIVGDVMGKYHPHGDSSIYEALVRMAQDFSYRYPLVDGHGNFGSIDGDGAAAMRYTEARMSRISSEMLRDIKKNTVNFVLNYDGTEQEPQVLPSRIPNLLVNGTTGIAVGMATNIPPHNLGEVIDGVVALMENPEITVEELMNYIKAPDFPTGGIIMGLDGLRQAYNTGLGTIVIRSKCEVIEPKTKRDHAEIVITEIPYGIRKSTILERIGQVAQEKVVDGIVELRDESSMKGMKIVIEVRNDVNPHVLLNNLFKYTPLQSSFGINTIALVDGRPEALSLKKALEVYLNHQKEVITRRTKFDLDEDLKRMHLLEGFIIAADNSEEVVRIIRESKNGEEKERLMARYNLSDRQAQAILEMQLRRLSGLNREKTLEEYHELENEVAKLNEILRDDHIRDEVIKNELLEIKEKYGDKRKSELQLHMSLNIENEDLIPREDVIITVTRGGYAKRMTVDTYHSQNRGGIGVSAVKVKENDQVQHFLYTNSHDYVLVFTNLGRVYKIKAYSIPEGSKVSKGIPLVNLFNVSKDETIEVLRNITNFDDEKYLMFITKKGIVKKTRVDSFKNIRQTGIIAIDLKDGDELLDVLVTDGHDEIVLGSSNGKALRFNEENVRSMGRNSSGVIGMKFKENHHLVGATVVKDENQKVLVLTEHGYGKITPISLFRLQNRSGQGVKALNVVEKNGNLVSLQSVDLDNDIIITTSKGMTIRVHVDQISETGRAAQGVRIVKIKEDQVITKVVVVPKEEDEVLEESIEAQKVED